MIVCSGDALIDMLPRQLEDGSDVFLPVPGGALFNTAVALGRLGEETAFVSGISTDMFGETLIAHLEESGVGTAYCVRSPRPTTLSPMTAPLVNATRSASPMSVRAASVVRTFAVVAVRMPMNPARTEQSAPTMKQSAVPPGSSPVSRQA